jgi:hypothetical protein
MILLGGIGCFVSSGITMMIFFPWGDVAVAQSEDDTDSQGQSRGDRDDEGVDGSISQPQPPLQSQSQHHGLGLGPELAHISTLPTPHYHGFGDWVAPRPTTVSMTARMDVLDIEKITALGYGHNHGVEHVPVHLQLHTHAGKGRPRRHSSGSLQLSPSPSSPHTHWYPDLYEHHHHHGHQPHQRRQHHQRHQHPNQPAHIDVHHLQVGLQPEAGPSTPSTSWTGTPQTPPSTSSSADSTRPLLPPALGPVHTQTHAHAHPPLPPNNSDNPPTWRARTVRGSVDFSNRVEPGHVGDGDGRMGERDDYNRRRESLASSLCVHAGASGGGAYLSVERGVIS